MELSNLLIDRNYILLRFLCKKRYNDYLGDT